MNRKLWPLLSGFTIWALAFVLLYALQALGCVWGWSAAPHRIVLIVVWIATLGSLGLLLFQQWRSPADAEPILSHAGIIATTASIAATIITFFPIIFVTLCV